MTFLPLLERELRARARSRATFWTRFAVVLVTMVVCLPELLSAGFGTQAGSSGKFIFNGIVVIGFLLACGGCLLTADVISRERREGTLGLLLLTRVRKFDLLLGKFGSAGLTSLCALAALLPLMMIPVLAGGVTGGEAFRKGLALLNMLFLALAVGLWASAKEKEMSRAIGKAIRISGAVVLLPELFEFFGPAPFPVLGPIRSLVAAGDKSYTHSPESYWISLLLIQIAGWVLLTLASRRLGAAMRNGEEKIPARFAGDEHYQSLTRKWPMAWTGKLQQPIEFLTQRQRGIGATIWAAALIGLILQFGGLVFLPFRLFGVASLIRWLPIHMLSGALLAWAMSRFMIEARRSGAFELLVTTPVGARTIVSGQWNALKQLLRWPLLVMVFPYLLQLLMVGWRVRPGWSLDQMIRQWAFILFGLVNTFFGIGALCWTGLWFGLKVRSQISAIAWTVGIAKGIPFLIYLFSQGLFATGIFSTGYSTPYDVRWYIPQFLMLLFYVRVMIWVRSRFSEELPDSDRLRFTLLRLVSQPESQPKISFETVRD